MTIDSIVGSLRRNEEEGLMHRATARFDSIIAIVALMVATLALNSGCAGNSTTGDHSAAADETLRSMTNEKPGSPYRWTKTRVGGGEMMERSLIGAPHPTAADQSAKADALKKIGVLEHQVGGSGHPALVETRLVSATPGKVLEVWVVARGDEHIAYTVLLSPSPRGGSDVEVKGPWE